MVTPAEIEAYGDSEYAASALFGYISGLSDPDFLDFVLLYRDHRIVRRAFFNDIRKRTEIPTDIVDRSMRSLLTDIDTGIDRKRNETFVRYLFPHLSSQMRAHTFRTVLRVGSKSSRNYLLRQVTPKTTPGIEADVLRLALAEKNESALVGIVYRWPIEFWAHEAKALFVASADHPWLQRQIIFKLGEPDQFLDQGIIDDPITELYVRAKFKKDASDELMDAAIGRAWREHGSFDGSNRAGLVAWCLGRYRAFERLGELPTGWMLPSLQITDARPTD